jgi:hypothetical protein
MRSCAAVLKLCDRRSDYLPTCSNSVLLTSWSSRPSRVVASALRTPRRCAPLRRNSRVLGKGKCATRHLPVSISGCERLGAARRGELQLATCVPPRLRRYRGPCRFRAISLIAIGSTGRRPLPQPVPLATDVVEHSLGAAEVRGDPRPIARTIFEDAAPDQLLLDLGRIGASALSAEEVGGRLDNCVHPFVSPCEWGRSVHRLLLRSWLALGSWLTLRSLRSKGRRYRNRGFATFEQPTYQLVLLERGVLLQLFP